MWLTVLANDASTSWNVSSYSLVFSFLWFNAQQWQVRLSRSQLKAKRTCGFGTREKIRCGLRFFGVFFCAVLRFLDPSYAPLLTAYWHPGRLWFLSDMLEIFKRVTFDKCEVKTDTVYIIIQIILTIWLVFTYDLLEDRWLIDIIITKLFPLCFKMAESFENLDSYATGQKIRPKKSFVEALKSYKKQEEQKSCFFLENDSEKYLSNEQSSSVSSWVRLNQTQNWSSN